MHNNMKITKDIKINTMLGKHMRLMTYNNNFCESISAWVHMPILSDDSRDIGKKSLIYDMSKIQGFDNEALEIIIDLLMQLRASQSDQNSFVQSNTIVRQQIISQLKNEIFKVQNTLSKDKIQKLEAISSDSFDENTLNDILKYLIKESKKKSQDNLEIRGSLYKNINDNLTVYSNISKNYTKIENLHERYKDIYNKKIEVGILEKNYTERKLVNLTKPVNRPSDDRISSFEQTIGSKIKADNSLNLLKPITKVSDSVGELSKIYNKKEFINRYILNSKVKLTDVNELQDSYKRELNYIIQSNIRDKYKKLTDISYNKILSKNLLKEVNLVSRRNTNNKIEEKIKLNTRLSGTEHHTHGIKRNIDESILKEHIKTEDIVINEKIKNNILDVYNKIISKSTVKNIVEKLVSRYKSETYKKEKINRLHIHDIQILNNTDKHLSHKRKAYITQKDIVNVVDSYNLHRMYSKIQNDVVNKYNVRSIYESKNESLSKVTDKINLVNQSINNNIDVNETENKINKINKKISKISLENKLRNKISNIEEEIITFSKDLKVYNETYIKHKNNLLKTNKLHEENKITNVKEIFKREFLLNSQEESKENLVRSVSENLIKTIKTKSHTDLRQEIEKTINEKLSTNIYKSVLLPDSKSTVNRFINTYIKDISKKHIRETSKHSNIYSVKNNIINNIKERQNISEHIIKNQRNEIFAKRNIEKLKNVFVNIPPIVNYEEIESKVKTVSENVWNKTLESVKPSRIKKSILNENKIINITDKYAKVVKGPLIIKENVNNTDVIGKIISKKIISLSSPDIRRVQTHQINEKNSYREVNQIRKSYFNDIQENMQERILLNRNNVLSQENTYRNVERDSIIYKTPISLKDISKQVVNEKEEKQGDANVFAKKERKKPIRNTVVNNYVESQSKEKPLREEDVVKMIKSYMGKIDIGTISDVVLKRVENEMETQRRRRGII